MIEVRFSAVVGEDGVIRVPAGVSLPGGVVEVTVRKAVTNRIPGIPSEPDEDIMAETRAMLLELAREAERIDPASPSDIAENHDYYAHGKPRP